MKIDFTQFVSGLDGKPLKDENKKEIKLSTPCVNALLANTSEDRFDGMEKLTRFILAQKIYKAEGEIELKAEEISKIKDLTGKYLPTLLAGSIWTILESSPSIHKKPG